MKFANFCDTGRQNINIGDYFQFMATRHLYRLMGIAEDEIVYLGFKDLAGYDGEEVVFPFCYSIIDFIDDGKIAISEKIKPVFFSVTLSTVDRFIDLDVFISDAYNHTYLLGHSPVGCRDEKTYDLLIRHNIPAYINGCMTAIFPKYEGVPGQRVLFADAPRSLLPFIPESMLDDYVLTTQQYHFHEPDIKNYHKIFSFVDSRYDAYQQIARIAVTSRLHVALPMAAFGIPVILAKDKIDGRFSFIEAYLPVYDRDNYDKINWKPCIPDMKEIKELLIRHAIGRITKNEDQSELETMEKQLTAFFQSRKQETVYENSHIITHKNGYRFDEFAIKNWKSNECVNYALWGASENNAEYWKNYIEAHYPKARLTAVFDSFRSGKLFDLPYQHPDKINDYPEVYIIVCSVGAAGAAVKLFKSLNIDEKRYCITSDSFILEEDIDEWKSTNRKRA